MASRVESSDDLVGAFRDLLDRHAQVTGALERRLQDEHGLGMSEFEVLEHLATAPDAQCRMQGIADVVHLSQSALSRVVARLEADGLVERCMCPTDRRGIQAVITAAGRERYAAALPTHRAVIATVLGDRT